MLGFELRTCRAPGHWAVVALCLALTSAACDRASSPTAPSEEPPATAPERSLTVSGIVSRADTAVPLPSARVEVADGINHGKVAMADAAGRYSLLGLEPGTFEIQATADGFEPGSQALTVTADRTADFSLTRKAGEQLPSPQPPPPTPTPTPAPRWRLTGTVSDRGTNAALGGVRLAISTGPNAARVATSDAQGRYQLDDLEAGNANVEARLQGYVLQTRAVTLDANRSVDFALERDAPVPPSGPPASGRTLDAISEQPLAGVTVRIDGFGETKTSGDGTFNLTGAGVAGAVALTASSSMTVERHTRIRYPAEAPTLTLIPRSISLTAFDEMFRARGGLHRWVQAPRLVIQRRVLQFTNINDGSYIATGAVITDAEVNELLADLSWALPQLSDGTFRSFAGVQVETAAAQEAVPVARPGFIVVARYEGLSAATTYWGYSRWAWNTAGEVEAGVMILDNAFELSGSPFRRSLRAHELGHTLGYDHVTTCPSVMNAAARLDPTPFDLDAARIAFQRLPLNQSPDTDPDPIVVKRMSASGQSWTGSP